MHVAAQLPFDTYTVQDASRGWCHTTAGGLSHTNKHIEKACCRHMQNPSSQMISEGELRVRGQPGQRESLSIIKTKLNRNKNRPMRQVRLLGKRSGVHWWGLFGTHGEEVGCPSQLTRQQIVRTIKQDWGAPLGSTTWQAPSSCLNLHS